MKVASGSSSQLFFGRNPTNQNQTYSAVNVNAVGPTARFTYTVPAARRAVIMHAFVSALRSVAATVNGTDAIVIYHQSPTVKNIVVQALVFLLGVGTYAEANQGESGIMLSGDVMLCQSRCGATTPNDDFEGHISLMEYDQ